MTIREATPEDAGGIARVHVDTWRTTYPGIMPQEHLDALSHAEYAQLWTERLQDKRGGWTHVMAAVTEAGEIVGFASGGKERSGDPDYTGEIYAVYLVQAAQGHGVGRRLVQALARRLIGEQYKTLLIWVNAHNSARRFYEALGGIAARTGQREIKGVTYDDVGYGWDEAAFAQLIEE